MLSFNQFITEREMKFSNAGMAVRGDDAERHAKNYVLPHVNSDERALKMKSDHGDLKAGEMVYAHGVHVDETGKHHAIVSDGINEPQHVPFSKIQKPAGGGNKGFDVETQFNQHLAKHGLSSGEGAGFTTLRPDATINDPREHSPFKKAGIGVEVKQNTKAAFGQVGLEFVTKKTQVPQPGALAGYQKRDALRRKMGGYWAISAKAKQKSPQLAKAIEKTTVTDEKGVSRPALDHINDVMKIGAPTKGRRIPINLRTDRQKHLDLVHAYAKDKDTHVLHIDSHGSYRVGDSEHKDHVGLGLPAPKGEASVRFRGKHPGSITAQVNVHDIEKSGIHLGTDEGVRHVKKKLGIDNNIKIQMRDQGK